MSKFVSWERKDPAARVLQITNMWPVEVAAPGPTGSPGPRYGIFVKRQVDSVLEEGVRCDVLLVRGFESRLAYPLAALMMLMLGLFGRRYRLVHAHGGETAFPARFYLAAPLIVTYYGSDLLGAPRADGTVSSPMRARRWLQRQHARLATRTITQSREMESVLPKCKQACNLILPSGVDPDLFHPVERTLARERLGWDETECVALFAANPGVQRKRYWLARDACRVARQQIDRLRLHVAADVPPDAMHIYMSAADCLLLTSSIEGSPNVVKEAILCNLPIVTTRVGDVEVVLNGVEPSWCCDSKPQALGLALSECLRERRRSNGRAMSSWLNSATIAEPLLDLYGELTTQVGLS